MIPIYKPFMPDNLMPELNEILYSGQLSYGKYGKQFEQKLKEYIGCEYLITISSYNTAMLVVLTTLGLRPGDEIIASPVSCLASNQPFVTKGLKVIWADIIPKTGTLCPTDVKSKINKNTKAIFHNHFCGYVGEITEINDLGKKFGVPIIDDGIEGFSAEYNGRKLGNLDTDLTIFSFQTVRLPNTIEGGALVFKDKALYEKAVLIRDYGIDRSKFRCTSGEINPDCDVISEGFGGLMNEVNSYIGIRQLTSIQQLLDRQRKNAKIWDKIFKGKSEVTPVQVTQGSLPNYWIYGLLSNNKRDVIDKFRNQGYYATGVHLNNNLYSVFKNKQKLKGVDDFINKFLAIPSGWWL